MDRINSASNHHGDNVQYNSHNSIWWGRRFAWTTIQMLIMQIWVYADHTKARQVKRVTKPLSPLFFYVGCWCWL